MADFEKALLREVGWAASVGLAALRKCAEQGSAVAKADLPRAERAVRLLDAAGVEVDD